jgi:hypothetical protein
LSSVGVANACRSANEGAREPSASEDEAEVVAGGGMAASEVTVGLEVSDHGFDAERRRRSSRLMTLKTPRFCPEDEDAARIEALSKPEVLC